MHTNDLTVREYLKCLGVLVAADSYSQGYNDPIPFSVGKLRGACVVAALVTGIPAIALENEALDYGREMMNNGDWRRQLALVSSYEERIK